MALPPRGDPQRPLFSAIRSMGLLGVVLILFSLIGILQILFSASTTMRSNIDVVFLFGSIFLAPGILYVLCAIFLEHRRKWAAIVGLVLASMQLLAAVIIVVVLVIAISPQKLVQFFGAEPVIMVAIVHFLLIVTLARLVYHLSKSFKTIGKSPQRGFEPIMIPPTQTSEQS
jgi:hypothetical protein